MQKRDAVQILAHNYNVEPLKEYIRSHLTPEFTGRKDAVIDFLKTRTLDELMNIVRYGAEYFQKDIFCFRLDDVDNYGFDNYKNKITDPNATQLFSLIDDTYEQIKAFPEVGKIHFLKKVVVEGFKLDVNTGKSIGGKSSITYYLPGFIDFSHPMHVKVQLSKFQISKGDHTHADGKLRLYITNYNFTPEAVARNILHTVVEGIVEKSFTHLSLGKSITEFVNERKMSTSEISWDKKNGIDYRTHGKKNQTLHPYEYICNKIEDALEVRSCKWFFTDPNVDAEKHSLKGLNYVRIYPAGGHIAVDLFQLDDEMSGKINELIEKSF